jgi:hypothetical protein
MRRLPIASILALLLAVNALPVPAASWPEIPDSDWQLTELADHPTAAAVVLLDRGALVLHGSFSSYLDVYRRIKILTEDGVDYGSVSLPSSSAFRMKDLEARTHRPDRTVVELSGDAVFEKRYSEYYKRSMTSFALPEVTAGAIIEYSYRIYFDSVLYPSPWYFQSRLPTLVSEFSCSLPSGYTFKPHAVQTLRGKQIEHKVHEWAHGRTVEFRMRNMPPIPDEPYRFPFDTLATRISMLPLAYQSSIRTSLLETWKSAVKVMQGDRDYGYKRFRQRDGGVGSTVKGLTAGAKGQQDKVRRLHEFVRDEIVTERYRGLSIGESTAGKVLSSGRGSYAEKALLLQHMLDTAKIDASVGWTSPCDSVRINTEVPNLGQLEHLLVVVDGKDGLVFLDPSDRTLAFGALQPSLEGVPCLLIDRKAPEWVTTPVTPAEQSARHAVVQLALDDEGRLSGTGQLDLTGHEAWLRIGWQDTPEEAVTAWTTWIEDRFPGFDVAEVTVVEQVDDRTVAVSWGLTQRDEEVLGDEASVALAAPLATTRNPFSLAPSRRLTPVMLDFPSTDIAELELTWPEGWSTAAAPAAQNTDSAVGSVHVSIDLDQAARRLHAVRTLTVTQRELIGATPYAQLRKLFGAAVSVDANELLLVAE